MNTTKLSFTAHKLEIFFKVLQKIVSTCVIVLLAVLTVATVVNAVNPDAVIATEVTRWDIGNLTLELSEELTPDNGSILRFFWTVSVIGAAGAVLVWFGLGYIRRILRLMADGKPFEIEISSYLKKLAYLALGLGVVQNVGMAVETTYSISFLGMEKLVESGMIRSVTANYTIEFTFVVVFFVLLLMSYIFTYGAELQNLSDETL